MPKRSEIRDTKRAEIRNAKYEVGGSMRREIMGVVVFAKVAAFGYNGWWR